MRKFRVRNVFYGLALFTAFACFGGSGTDCSNDPTIITNPEIAEFYPCKAAPGEDIVIRGQNFFPTQGTGYVRIGGIISQVKSWSDGRIVATVPNGATTQKVAVVNGDGSNDLSRETLEIGVRAPTSEIEPNEAIDGADATDTGNNQAGTGNLTTVADRDHYRINCIHWRTYKVKVTPAIVNVVYVNGQAVTLDANGEGAIDGRAVLGGSVVIGLTGGTGNYTVTVTPDPAP